jgi:hypothetical protein
VKKFKFADAIQILQGQGWRRLNDMTSENARLSKMMSIKSVKRSVFGVHLGKYNERPAAKLQH